MSSNSQENAVLEPEDSGTAASEATSHWKLGFNWQDLRVAAALGAGKNKSEAARFAKVTRVTVDNRLKNNKVWIEEAIGIIREAVASEIEDARIETKEQLDRYLNRLRNKTVKVYERALDSDNEQVALAAAEKVLDRIDGKATQKIQQEGVITHQVVALPGAVLQGLIASVEKTQHLLGGEVIEGEVVGVDDGSAI